MAENWILRFLELYFYLKYISNKDDIWQVETLLRVLLEEKTKQFNIIKKSIMAARKWKNIWFQAALKDFWSSVKPKLKKNQVCQTLNHTEQNAWIESSGQLRLSYP